MKISVDGNSNWNDAKLSVEWNDGVFHGFLITIYDLSGDATVLIQPEQLRRLAEAAMLCVPDKLPDCEGFDQ